MNTETYNMIADTLPGTFRLLGRALLAARGTRVVVAPFDDTLLARFGVWVEGPADQVVGVIQVATKAANKAGDKVVTVPYMTKRGK